MYIRMALKNLSIILANMYSSRSANLYIYIKLKPLVAPQFSTSTQHNI